MTEIMPVPRNLILLSYQQRAFAVLFLFLNNIIDVALYSRTFYRADRIKSYK